MPPWKNFVNLLRISVFGRSSDSRPLRVSTLSQVWVGCSDDSHLTLHGTLNQIKLVMLSYSFVHQRFPPSFESNWRIFMKLACHASCGHPTLYCFIPYHHYQGRSVLVNLVSPADTVNINPPSRAVTNGRGNFKVGSAVAPRVAVTRLSVP